MHANESKRDGKRVRLKIREALVTSERRENSSEGESDERGVDRRGQRIASSSVAQALFWGLVRPGCL